MKIFSQLKYIDIPLAVASGLLLLLGLAILYSSSLANIDKSLFYRQAIFSFVGLLVFLALTNYNYQNLSKRNRYFYLFIVVVLFFVLIFGRSIRGSSRWIDFGFFRFQPAEFAKLTLIATLSRWLFLARGQINSWKNIFITGIITLIPAILIFLEPDLGSTIILIVIWLGLLLASPISKKKLLIILLCGVIVSGLAWKFVLRDFQKQRVEIFLNPSLDPQGKGYNVRQATIAVGSGSIFGRGLGQGLQSQLKFLPERQTDFIFATTAEEVGFLGSMGIMFVYAFILWRIKKISENAKDDLAMYICAGVWIMLFGQIVINIGMNIGLLPVTGIPLPLFSYGGSSLLVVLASLGIVQNIAMQNKALRF